MFWPFEMTKIPKLNFWHLSYVWIFKILNSSAGLASYFKTDHLELIFLFWERFQTVLLTSEALLLEFQSQIWNVAYFKIHIGVFVILKVQIGNNWLKCQLSRVHEVAPKKASIYYVSIFWTFLDDHPLCQHKYSTECQQKWPFSELTQPHIMLT